MADEPATPSLAAILDLEQVEPDHLRAHAFTNTRTGRMFGGDVAAQALAAAHATVPADRPVHSLHGYFLLGGDPTVPVELLVDRTRDGGSFTTRIVRAEQHGRCIFTLTASFQRPEEGIEHQPVPTDVEAPQDCLDVPAAQELAESVGDVATAAWLGRMDRDFPWELRFPDPRRTSGPPGGRTWFRLRGELPGPEPHHHAAALTNASDMLLLGAAIQRHGIRFGDEGLFVTSLDHAVWFHRPVRVDGWLLYDRRSAWAGGGRALCRGRFWTADGELVATVAQEGLVRTG